MFVSNIYFLILILLTILISVNSSVLLDDDQLFVIRVEYGYNQTEFPFEVLNRDDAEINDFLSSRIAFMDGSDNDKEIFDIYSSYINKYWMFLVNSSSVADSLLQREDYEKNELYINGIIVPESLNYKMPSTNNNKKIPIFIVKDNITKNISAYDIRKMDKHNYFLFEIKRAISTYPEVYLLVISIITLISAFAMVVYWNVKMKSVARVDLLRIQRALYTIPIFIFLLAIALIVKAIDIRGQDPYRNYDDSIYINTALITLSAIYRTALWLFLLFISCGYKISINRLPRGDVKFLLKSSLIIYILMCLDQIIDERGVKLWVFHLSEIKNILFYAGIMYILFKRINKNLRFLERKLFYARLLAPEYIEALAFKIKLMKKVKWILYAYLGLFFFILLLHKTALLPYDSSLLETFNYNFVDVCLSVSLLYVFRPQQLPPNFDTDLGNNLDEDLGLVYKAFLPRYDMINDVYKDNPKDIQSMKGKNIPILVLGPCLSHYDTSGKEEISMNNYINNIGIGFAT